MKPVVIVGGSGGVPPDLGPFRGAVADIWVVLFSLSLLCRVCGGRVWPAMASRVKEDEKNERVIRGLLKLPANKRCINCNNLVSSPLPCSSSSFDFILDRCWKWCWF